VGYLRLKDARSLIPEIDGHSRQKMQEFISASIYAIEKINFAEKLAFRRNIKHEIERKNSIRFPN